MKFKRVMAAILAAGMVFSLAACGSGGGENGDDSGNSGDVTITFSTNVVGAKAEALEAACRDFEEETGYTVDFQAPGESYEELMKTKMSANELPDVFTTHGWSVARYSDYLMPVNDLDWASDINDQIKPVITDSEGNMYVLPIDMDIAGIICNMTVLEEAGVNPDDIKTWDDFAAACDKIKAAGKTPIHMGGKDSWTIGQYFDWAAPSYYITDEANSHADELKNGTFASPAMALANSVLPVPGGPSRSTPLGIRAPTFVYLEGSFRKSMISSRSSFSSFSPATSFRVILLSFPVLILARLLPKFIILLPLAPAPAFWAFIIMKKKIMITAAITSTGSM